jgi:hypothetical protein
MKIWNGYGSEHSANLIMIGTFKEIKDAKEAFRKIDILKDQVDKDQNSGKLVVGGGSDIYSDAKVARTLSKTDEKEFEEKILSHSQFQNT